MRNYNRFTNRMMEAEAQLKIFHHRRISKETAYSSKGLIISLFIGMIGVIIIVFLEPSVKESVSINYDNQMGSNPNILFFLLGNVMMLIGCWGVFGLLKIFITYLLKRILKLFKSGS